MPNWCNNNIEITGKEENVKKFVEDFNEKGFECIGTSPEEGWYEWNLEHFGTKWNIHPKEIEWLDYNNCSFMTAWSPPLPFYESASEKYQIKIKASYEEYGCMIVGCFEVNYGVVEYNILCEPFNIDSLEIIECIYGDVDNYIEAYEYMYLDGFEKENDYKDRLESFEEFKKYVEDLK